MKEFLVISLFSSIQSPTVFYSEMEKKTNQRSTNFHSKMDMEIDQRSIKTKELNKPFFMIAQLELMKSSAKDTYKMQKPLIGVKIQEIFKKLLYSEIETENKITKAIFTWAQNLQKKVAVHFQKAFTPIKKYFAIDWRRLLQGEGCEEKIFDFISMPQIDADILTHFPFDSIANILVIYSMMYFLKYILILYAITIFILVLATVLWLKQIWQMFPED